MLSDLSFPGENARSWEALGEARPGHAHPGLSVVRGRGTTNPQGRQLRLEKPLERPLDGKQIQLSNLKETSPGCSSEALMLELKL